MISQTNVLVVDDEAHMRRLLRTTLKHNGYDTIETPTARGALDNLATGGIGLVLLDLGLPDMDGTELTTKIREDDDVPIIVISARDSEHAKIEALDRGANDYLTKPFRVGELLARVRAALRVATQVRRLPASSQFSVGDLKVDLESQIVRVRGAEVALTPTEYRLLQVLVRRAGRTVTHRELLRDVWGPDSLNEFEYLRVYMSQLRCKLEEEPAQPRYLLTVSGVGYRLRADG